PLSTVPLFSVGPVGLSAPVLATWAIMAVLVALALVARRRLSVEAPSRLQSVLELFVATVDAQIADTMQTPPARYRAL
ncbi:F0F1 ATP synthase subunit A, partial [Burkholderia pseudomallei]